MEARALAVCPACGTWGSFLPFPEEPNPKKVLSTRPARFFLGPILGALVGEVPGGTVILLGGEPGVGKSTLA
ncbi:MAG: DNA repair protein RadA, partial [Candidatus Bipolaricaulaceae bacterium]